MLLQAQAIGALFVRNRAALKLASNPEEV